MLKNHLRIALRSMRRESLYAALNVGGLAIGFACCLLVGAYILHETSFDRFHEKGDRTYRLLFERRPGADQPSADLSEYHAWGSAAHAPFLLADFPEIERVVRLSGHHEILVSRDDRSFQELAYFYADSSFFGLFSFPLLRGDPATVLVRPNSVVLTTSTARRYFGEEDPVGRTLLLDSETPLEVTGIMEDVPPNSHLAFDLLISMSTFEVSARTENADYQFDEPGYIDFFTYVLLDEDVSEAQVEARLPSFVQRHYPNMLEDATYSLALEPITDVYHSAAGRADAVTTGLRGNPRNLYLFGLIGAFILAIACFNFVNLATARSASRAKEVGVRKSVGARRRQLVTQFLTEAVLVAAVATVLALGIAYAALPLFGALAGKTIPAALLADPRVLAALVVTPLIVGLLAGGYPAAVLSRFRPSRVLKGDVGMPQGSAGLRKVLVAFQFATAMALIAGTLIVRSQLDYLRERPLGFDKEQQLVLDFGMDESVRTNIEARKDVFGDVPGVRSVAATRSVPGGYFPDAGTQIEAPDGSMLDIDIGLFEIDDDILPQLDVRMAAGRHFDSAVATDVQEGLLINESAARDLGYANPAEAVGKRFSQWGREGRILGVVQDFNHESLHRQVQPLSFRLSDVLRFLVLKVEARPGIVEDIQGQWAAVIPHRPFNYAFLDQSFDTLYRAEDRFGRLFGVFSALAVLVACIGLFGLAAYAVRQRRKEIGIRKVLGATSVGIAALLTRDFLMLVAAGFAFAVPVAYIGMTRWLQEFAYRIELGPGIFLAAGLLTIVVALATLSYESVRAALADPTESLRHE